MTVGLATQSTGHALAIDRQTGECLTSCTSRSNIAVYVPRTVCSGLHVGRLERLDRVQRDLWQWSAHAQSRQSGRPTWRRGRPTWRRGLPGRRRGVRSLCEQSLSESVAIYHFACLYSNSHSRFRNKTKGAKSGLFAFKQKQD